MPFLASDSSTIYYETHGDGPPLVLIHAISAGADMWRPQIERFSRERRVIVFDAPGVGRSGPIRGWHQVRDHIADDIANLLTHLGLQRAAVCGVSFGGVIAQHLAARHPSLIERLVIVDAYSDTRPTTPSKALWLASVYAGSTSNFLPSRALAAILRRQYDRWPDAADYVARAVAQLRPTDAFKSRLAINLVNYPPALNAADYPILGVVGDSSWPRSLAFMEELSLAVPRTRLVRVADANDPTPLCQPERFNDILADFLHEEAVPERT